MGRYYYNLKNDKKLEYNSAGFYYCPELLKAIDANDWAGREKHKTAQTGGSHITILPSTSKKDENGDTIITETRKVQHVVKGRKDLYCRCGLLMEFKGYPVSIKKVKSVTRIPGLGVAEDSKQISKRWFKTKKAQQDYINKMVRTG